MISWLLLQLFSPLIGMLATTWGLGALCVAMAILAPAWLPISRFPLLMAGAGLMFAGVFYAWAFKAGEAHMTQLIAARDQAAVARVDDALKRLNECGPENWDVVSGTCNK